MSAFGPTEIAEAFVDAINKHDIESLCKLMSKDSVFVDALGTRVEGVRSLRLAWQEFFAACPAYVMVLDAVSATGDTVGLFGSAAGMHGQPRDGQGFGDDAIPAAWRATIRGGLIAEWRVYCNVTSIVDTVEICDATPARPDTGFIEPRRDLRVEPRPIGFVLELVSRATWLHIASDMADGSKLEAGRHLSRPRPGRAWASGSALPPQTPRLEPSRLSCPVARSGGPTDRVAPWPWRDHPVRGSPPARRRTRQLRRLLRRPRPHQG